MLSAEQIGNHVLKGLFYDSGTVIDLRKDFWLALFTQMPTGVDGSGYAEPTAPEYMRPAISGISRIKKVKFMASAVEEIIEKEVTITDTDGQEHTIVEEVKAAVVKNQDSILFPEASQEGGWGNIVGFGLVYSETVGDGLPFLWGEITAEDGSSGITVDQYEVPIIRVGGFKITLA